MLKIKPERIAGIVALSYLVLIPAGGFLAWRKIQTIDKDLTEIWNEVNRSEDRTTRTPLIDLGKIREGLNNLNKR